METRRQDRDILSHQERERERERERVWDTKREIECGDEKSEKERVKR